MHEVEAKNLARAVESLELEDGEKVIVYRVANRRKAIVRTETTRYIEVE